MILIKKAIMHGLSKIFYGRVFEIRCGLAKGLKRRFGRGFKPRLFLTKEENFLFNLDFRNKTVFDIGGYIGIFSLFFAREAGSEGTVFTFEPNPENYKELVFNINLNGFKNIKPFNLAIGNKSFKQMLVEPVYPSRGSLSLDVQKRMSKNVCNSFMVEVDSVDNLIEAKEILNPDFVKIDTEGFEMEVLKGMKETISKYKPFLLIELHGGLKKEMLDFILGNQYSIYCIETQKKITSLEGFTKNSHLYCKPD